MNPMLRNCVLVALACVCAVSKAQSIPTVWDVGNWSVSDRDQSCDCIRVQSRLAVHIVYSMNKNDSPLLRRVGSANLSVNQTNQSIQQSKSEPVFIPIPNDAVVDKTHDYCNGSIQTLRLEFFDDWYLEVMFTNDQKLGATKSTQFTIYGLNFYANLAAFPDTFVDCANPHFQINTTNSHVDFFRRNYSAPITADKKGGKYLHCESNITSSPMVNGDESVWLQTDQMHMMMAFNSDCFKTDMMDDKYVKTCAYDTARDDLWLKIGTAVSIGAVLLVFFGYIMVLLIKGPIKVKLDENTTRRWEVPTVYQEESDSMGTLNSVTPVQRRIVTTNNVFDRRDNDDHF